jgi:hypothetical protein
MRLEPAHRLSLLEYRRFGLVYPFGAANYHFNTPNRTIFTPTGQWMQSDHADPLESWEYVTTMLLSTLADCVIHSMSAILEAGQRHGAVKGDLYGCLYFYVTEQLRTFAERLSRFRIKFHVFCKDAHDLSEDITEGRLSTMLPRDTKFDRVDVSNTLDAEYIGIPQILSDWGTLLKENSDAAVVGYFMNWARKFPGSSYQNSDKTTIARTMKKMFELGRVSISLQHQQ